LAIERRSVCAGMGETMSFSLIRVSLVASIVALASACGDASLLDGSDGGNGGTPTPGAPVPATLSLLASSPQISSDATTVAGGVVLTAVVKDSSQNVVEGVTVAFSTTDTGVNITVTQAVTDASGVAQAVLTVGTNPQNRTVTVSGSTNGVSDTVAVNVVGTTLTLSGPTSGQFNTAASYVATLTDASGTGIPDQSVAFTSAGGSFTPASAQTNSSGQVTASFTPTTSASSTTIQAAALGITSTQTITLSQDSFAITAPATNQEITLGASATVSVSWTRSGSPVAGKTVTFSSTRGTFATTTATTDANGVASVTISSTQAGFAALVASGTDTTPDPDSTPTTSVTVEFVATTPAQLSLQAEPTVIATNQDSTISAVVRDANNNLVKNAQVNFNNSTDTTGGTLSAPSAITNSQGVASVVYSSTSTTSAQDGVIINATVAGASSVTDSVALTIGSRAARIVLGTGNELFENDTTTYRIPYTAIVTDNAGNAAPDADLRLRVAPTQYSKGFYAFNEDGELVQVVTVTCPNEDANSDGILQTEDVNHNCVLDAGEDTDGDSVLDGEDTDCDGGLDPGNVASVPSGSLPLDEDGRADFDVLYPQDRGNWVQVRLTATATVTGTEASESATFDLKITQADASNPPGSPSPYGVISRCDLDDANVPTVEFATLTSAAATEGTTSTVTVTVEFTAPQDASGNAVPFQEDVIVPLAYAGSADNGTDFSAPSSVTIPAGSTSATFDVTINDDVTVEASEDVLIGLGQPDNALIGGRDAHQFDLNSNE